MKVIQRLLKLTLALGLFLGLTTLPIRAADIGFGIVGNAASFDTTGTETEGQEGTTTTDSETTTTSVSDDAAFVSFFGELAVGREDAGLGFTIGFEFVPGEAELGAKSRTDAEDPADRDSDDGTYTAKAEVDNLSTLYFEPTYYINENYGLYLRGGVSRVQVNTLESIAFGSTSSTYADKGLWGISTGIGIKGVHSSGAYFKLEYTETDYDDIKLSSETGNKNVITADVDQQATRLAIGYAF